MSESKLIERYLSVMAEHLPAKERAEVANEMRANIMDMLPELPSDEDVRIVLEKLGDPVSLANEYYKDRKHILGLSVYNSYISVLKLVVGIVAIVFAFFSLMGNLFGEPGPNTVGAATGFTVDMIIDIFSAAFQGALIAFAWVTVIFIVLDRTGVNSSNPFRRKSWTINDLPQPSTSDKGKISRVETIIGLLLTIFFTVLLLTKPQLVGWYEEANGVLVLRESFFNIQQLHFYSFAITMFAALKFILSIYQYIVKRWNLPMAIFNAVDNIALCIFVYVLATDLKFINPSFISLFAEKAGWTIEKAMTAYQKLATGFVVFFIIMSAVDSISGFVKSRRLKLPSFNINIK